MKEVITLKVAANSNVKAVAGSISHALKGDDKTPGKDVEILAIGAGAVNQAIKAVAISSGHIAMTAQSVIMRAGFKVAQINDEEKTIIRLIVTLQ